MKYTVLFVDDEQNIIQGIKRMLYNMRTEWNILFATNGNEAIDILSLNRVDVIISDMRMSGKDGAELLDYVKKHYPHIIRIILSGYSDEEMILRSVGTTHQYFTKPCNLEILKQTIKKIYSLRNLIQNESLIKAISRVENLPSLPSLYYRLEEEIQRDNISLKKIGDIIAQDAVMTARVLQLVNSAFFGLRQKIASPQQAAAFLGINSLKMLVLYIHIFSTFKNMSEAGHLFDDFWNHSIKVSRLAMGIAQTEFNDKNLAEEAYTSGLLHDIGKLILMQIPEYYNQVESLVNKTKCSYTQAEYNLFGTSHAEVGAYLLCQWGIPDSIIEVIAFHHQVSRIDDKMPSVSTAVHAANGLIMPEVSASGQVSYPNIDMNYLNALNLVDKLEIWESMADDIQNSQ